MIIYVYFTCLSARMANIGWSIQTRWYKKVIWMVFPVANASRVRLWASVQILRWDSSVLNRNTGECSSMWNSELFICIYYCSKKKNLYNFGWILWDNQNNLWHLDYFQEILNEDKGKYMHQQRVNYFQIPGDFVPFRLTHRYMYKYGMNNRVCLCDVMCIE